MADAAVAVAPPAAVAEPAVADASPAPAVSGNDAELSAELEKKPAQHLVAMIMHLSKAKNEAQERYATAEEERKKLELSRVTAFEQQIQDVLARHRAVHATPPPGELAPLRDLVGEGMAKRILRFGIDHLRMNELVGFEHANRIVELRIPKPRDGA